MLKYLLFINYGKRGIILSLRIKNTQYSVNFTEQAYQFSRVKRIDPVVKILISVLCFHLKILKQMLFLCGFSIDY